MSKLPIISGEKAVKCFENLGYVIVNQKGSHIRMRHGSNKSKKPLTIPKHNMLGKGLLRKLVRDAEISVEEFNELL
ncbi:MAG: HicA toxin of bacterial toxin-antitoxin_ [Candidatus Argoarchaeum ethanivorans]|uniref:HicA toxin of bacterial toxin-antitoxin n=1 Tax=Candidatus Argoarchaeum ethanivorans TaxID=2608793 RepID=A0A811TK44_9EURY|nr:MAG: HicA toxin of bacterial toxin-antitoxin_ [Candidatus Argoarchaeum ethanivorans]